MDNSRTSKVKHTTAIKVVLSKGEETLGGPHPVGNHGVDEAADKEGHEWVHPKAGALGDGAGNDGNGSRGKGPLVEPGGVVIEVSKSDIGLSNEGISLAEGEGEAEEVENDGHNSSAQQVLEKDGQKPAPAREASLKQGKTSPESTRQK